MSSTFDAFQRMAAGLEGRTIADKLADPNRPTWEQYKKENEDKLDLVGVEVRNMVEYRSQLDKERERRLLTAKSQSQSRKDSAISDSGMKEKNKLSLPILSIFDNHIHCKIFFESSLIQSSALRPA